MIQRLLLIMSSLSLCYGLNCYHCGVFLNAPTSQCRGAPKNISCDPDHYGCLTITGERGDGTYYVEKRCAEKSDDHTVDCKESTIQGIKVQKCFCEGDLCNNSRTSFSFASILILLTFLSLMNKNELLYT